jgi:rubrerythrin
MRYVIVKNKNIKIYDESLENNNINIQLKFINALIDDEILAIKAYENAITECSDKKAKDVFIHILSEEQEHLEELEELKTYLMRG